MLYAPDGYGVIQHPDDAFLLFVDLFPARQDLIRQLFIGIDPEIDVVGKVGIDQIGAEAGQRYCRFSVV